jgi:membrane protease YdiL (CAAX protease family)
LNTRRLIPIIAAGEGLMAIVAIVWARWIRLPLPIGEVRSGALWGLAGAAALLTVNLVLLRAQSNAWPGHALRYVCRAIVAPLFEHVGLGQIMIVSVLAGLGEELLFRGVMQPLVGLVAASVLFGAMHTGGRTFIGYGLWAACIGAVMGWLMIVSRGLIAPVIAHAVYDAAALAYVRFGAPEV